MIDAAASTSGLALLTSVVNEHMSPSRQGLWSWGCPACARGADATASTPAPSSRLSVSPPCDRVSSAAVPATDDGSGIQVERTERLMTAVCAIEGPTGSPSAWSAC